MTVAVQLRQSEPAATLRLRVLATTDLHGHLLPWDYYRDMPLDGFGLARVATLIRQARAEAENCLYFDNGDLIEGSPLAEYAIEAGAQAQPVPHPMIAALNALGCDAAALGNHEFSYGLGHLKASLLTANYPVLSANILTHKGMSASDDTPLFAPWAMLERSFTDTAGVEHILRIGLLGLTPPQMLDWDKAVLPADVRARDMVETARYYVPIIRACGADVVVVLAHTGLGAAAATGAQAGLQPGLQTATGLGRNLPMDENVGLGLSALPGIDALVLGHEHQTFPQPVGSTASSGLVGQVPVVMPGAYGSHLGIIDLDLIRADGIWRIDRAQAACRAIAARGVQGQSVPLVGVDPDLAARAEAAHQATRAWMARPVGRSDVPLHSYFAIATPTAMQALIAAAQAAHLADLVAGTVWQGLPILSAVAPFKTGGRGGPDHFTAVPAGPLHMRNAADLYVHPNHFAAIVMTGAQLRIWLERAASTYAHLRAGGQDQPLLNPAVPATCLDMIYGVTCLIDLSQPAAFVSPTGVATGHTGRIRDLRFRGTVVQDSMRFALATNSHRLGVMLGVMEGAGSEVIADGTGQPASREVLLRHLGRGTGTASTAPTAWAFSPMPGTSVVLDTSPDAVPFVADIAAFAPDDLGVTTDGFQRFRLHL